MSKYTLGLDIGITSVGWAAIDQENAKLIDFGVRMFEKAQEAKDSRLPRSARRTLRRKKWRKEQLLKALSDYGLIEVSKDKYNNITQINGIDRKEYLNFNSTYNGLEVPNVETVYHLRQKALKEQITTRELLLCLYNILQARGHFLLETIDFDKEGVSYNTFRDGFYEIVDKYELGQIKNIDEFENKVLRKIYGERIVSKDIDKIYKENRFFDDEDEEKCFIILSKLLKGYKANLVQLIDKENQEKNTTSVDILKKADTRNDLEEKIVNLYDIIQIAKNLQEGCNYVCDVDVKHFEEFKKIITNKKLSDIEKKEKLKSFINASSSKKENWYGRSIKNLDHSYPNGMYVKEAVDMLNNQSKYNSKISPALIEIVSSIISARIPYFIGPLGNDAKNAWAVKNGKINYSYKFSKNEINEFESIKKWKERMISHCTYLPEECALPKGSLIGEIYSILNELNNYNNVKDKDNNDYYLTQIDKIKVFDELFLKKKDVTFDEIKSCLNLSEFGNKKQTMKKFNNNISIYLNIVNIIPNLKLNSLTDIFADTKKIEKIESIILDINLFDEEKSKYENFKESYKEFNDEQCKALSKLKSSNFYNVSYKFLMDEPLNKNSESMMTILLDDNSSSEKNNQMVIIQNACDKDGNKKDYSANKYEKIIKENKNELSFDLIMQDGKAIMPISRPVVRSLNETLKIYKAVLDLYGAPEKVIIETASGGDSIKDFTEQSGSPVKRYKKMEMLYDYLEKQIKESKSSSILRGKLESWKELEDKYKKNKDKIELYIRQDGIDLLTGKSIVISNLDDYEIDHILPRGFGDDSMDDKMLTLKLANSKKGDRLPIEFLESNDAITFTNMTVGHYTAIVNSLFDMRLISDKKRDRLLLQNQDEVESFINQNLVDTRYIIREFRSILNAYNKVNNFETRIVNLRGVFTSVFRRYLGIKKVRNLGDQHHAYDAATICLVDNMLNQYYPNYDQRGGMKSYNSFLELMDKHNTNKDDEDSKDRLKNIITFSFYKAYGQDIRKSSLLKELKDTTPLISWKVEKNYQSKFFDANPLTPRDKNDNSVLTILGINNNKRSFDTVNPCAIDFYKIKGKHYAIHIPFAIIDRNGNISKEKYLKLIKEHYKADDLIKEDGTLRIEPFRFRAFKNDIIYESCSFEPYRFNLGGIANKLLDIKNLNIYAYNEICGSYTHNIYYELIKKFNIKTKNNIEGVEFYSLKKEEMIKYLCSEFNIIDNLNRYIKSLVNETKEVDNIYEFCMSLAYLSTLTSKKYCPPTIVKQNMPSANNNVIRKNLDAEWVKLKYHPLGVRFSNNDNGKLVIKGPNGKTNAYKRIKREEFSWKISKM